MKWLFCHKERFAFVSEVSLIRFALAIWRDESMRLDLLLRDQLRAQRASVEG